MCDGYEGLMSLELITVAYRSAKGERVLSVLER